MNWWCSTGVHFPKCEEVPDEQGRHDMPATSRWPPRCGDSLGCRLQGSVQSGRQAGPDLARQRPQRLALGSNDRRARLTAMRDRAESIRSGLPKPRPPAHMLTQVLRPVGAPPFLGAVKRMFVSRPCRLAPTITCSQIMGTPR